MSNRDKLALRGGAHQDAGPGRLLWARASLALVGAGGLWFLSMFLTTSLLDIFGRP